MTTTHCRACQAPLSPGEALAVTDLQTGDRFEIHRPQLDARCFPFAGTADLTSIALLDPEAARRLDASMAARPPERAYG